MKVITVYELLGMIKDGNIPKKVKWNYHIYIYDEQYDDYFEETTGLFQNEMDNGMLFKCLNDEIEIIEEEKDIEEIKITKDDNSKRFIEYDDKTGYHKYTIRLLDEYFSNKINELVRVTKQLKKEINMIKKEGK